MAVIASGAISTMITLVFSRTKVNAETESVKIQTYSKMLEDLRKQMEFISTQVENLQKKEVEYLRIIGNHQKTERELRSRIKELETTLNNHLKTLN